MKSLIKILFEICLINIASYSCDCIPFTYEYDTISPGIVEEATYQTVYLIDTNGQ
jgi:hypothetical protein